MPGPIATGMISIVDYTDAPSLSAFISTTSPKSQNYNPSNTTYIPDWTNPADNPVLTPSLMISTTGNDERIGDADVVWYDASNPAESLKSSTVQTPTPYTIDGPNLKITENLMTGNTYSKTYIAQISWVDPNTLSTLIVRCDFTFTRANTGATGSSGSSAVTAVLSNESHSVPTDINGANGNFTGASSTISVFQGTTDDSSNWVFTQNVVDLVGTVPVTTPINRTFTITDFAVGKDAGYVDFTATKSGQSITKRFNVSKNKAGSSGLSATSYWLTVSNNTITKNNVNAYSPTTVSINAFSKTGTDTETAMSSYYLVIEESINGGTSWISPAKLSAAQTTAYTYTPTAQSTSAINLVRIRLYSSSAKTAVLDEESITILSDGSAVIGVLSNDSVTVPTLADGSGGVYTSIQTKMSVYLGTVDDSNNGWTYTTPTISSGVSASFAGSTPNTDAARTVNITAIANGTDSGYVDIKASKSGKSDVIKRFTISKNKQGISATTYWLVVPSAITKSQAGTFSPEYITTISAKSQTGSAAAGAFSGVFNIQQSSDNGATWKTADQYSSPVTNESAVARYPIATANGGTGKLLSDTNKIRVQLYKAGTTSANFTAANLLDEETITVVQDGPTGPPAITIMSWAPNGNVFRNNLSSELSMTVQVYEGGNLLSSGVTYEWFVPKSGNADEGGGTGWVKLTDANKTTYGMKASVTINSSLTTLILLPDAVLNTMPIKVKATYNSKSYFDTTVFHDQTDPIYVKVESSNGEIFKNGNVNSRLTCLLTQNGAEIDPVQTKAVSDPPGTPGGTFYTYVYTWTKWKMDGNQDMDFGGTGISTRLGKWIDIDDKDVSQKAVFKVEIS